MTPDECASIRSMARWVLPVLVGPSTAVTPKPGARPLANVDAEEEKTMFSGDFCVVGVGEVFHNATHLRSRLKLWNESGTNRARIGDSYPLRLRSPQHLALTPHCGTRSSLARIDKRRFGGEILKSEENAESNQKRARVNRDSATSVIPGWCVSTRPGISRFRVRCFASPRNDGTGHHCVLATRGGDAWVLNWVASSMAVPSGVGMII